LWKLLSTYRGGKAITSFLVPRVGGLHKLRNFFEVGGNSAVCVTESMVWVGLNAVLVTRFEWLCTGLTRSADKYSENPISGRCEWGVGPIIGSEPQAGGSKVSA
jgi:hypothetical protein